MPASSLVVLGRLTKPHGVKGNIRVDYYADSADLLDKPLMLRAGRFAPRPIRVREWHLWKELLIDASFLPEADEDEPYLRDLIGLSVRLEDGTLVGELEDVDFPAGQEMWVIRAPEEDGGHEILFPAVPEFVLDIDLSAQTATIAPPEGLLDLYREGAASVAPDDGQDENDAEEGSARRA